LYVEFGGQEIPGSPLITEIVDPSKILLQGMKRNKVGEPMVVDGKLLDLLDELQLETELLPLCMEQSSSICH